MYEVVKTNSDSIQSWIKGLKEFQLDSMFDTNVLAKAYLYTNLISVQENSIKKINAIVGEERKYAVSLLNDGESIYGECSCPYEGKCKHLAALMLILLNK